MNRIALKAGFALALAAPLAPIAAQEIAPPTRAEVDEIIESVVRIRTIADLAYGADSGNEGAPGLATRPYSVDGTGVVIGEMWVDGRLEYLVLTNHHVADASNYVREVGGQLQMNPTNTLAFPSVPEESYLMKEARDSIGDDDIRLIEMVRFVSGDMTLMRTVNANRDLVVFPGRIGYQEGEIEAGARIVTSGYPYGGAIAVGIGSVVEVDHHHDLGLPHEDLVIDVPVHPGQSGGPVLLIEPGEGVAERFRLIGLAHARDQERSYAVSYRLWESVLDEFPEELLDRLVR